MLSEKTKLASKCLLTGCAALTLAATGCRSMPGMGMFGMRGSEPSAETLAGAGPTHTYPPPPSASANPQAIASIAGGTGVPVSNGEPEAAQVAGLNLNPGFATPASTNMSAAEANGFAGTTKPAGFTTPSSGNPSAGKTSPSGYRFGPKAFTPKTSTAGVPGGSSYTNSSNYQPPKSSYALPNKPATPPAAASVPESAGGFTLPTNLSPAVAAATQTPNAPSIDPEPPQVPGDVPSAPPGGFSPPAADGPVFSTASAADTLTAPSTTIRSPLPPAASPAGYSPGSTGSAAGYPTGEATPNTNGSFFR